MSATPDPLLRPADVAALHPGLTEAILEKHRRRGTGPRWFRRSTRAVAYLTSDVDEWITQQRQAADRRAS